MRKHYRNLKSYSTFEKEEENEEEEESNYNIVLCS